MFKQLTADFNYAVLLYEGFDVTMRAGVFVDVDFMTFIARSYDAPSLPALTLALQRKFRPPSGILLFGTKKSFPPHLIAELTALRHADFRIIQDGSTDVALAVAAMRELPKLDNLVLLSGDADFIPVVEAAKAAGVTTTMVAPQRATAFGLAAAVDERIDPTELFETIDGLIRVGDGPRMAASLAKYLSTATRHIVIIDNFVNEETIRLTAGADPAVEIVVISRTFGPSTKTEAAAAKAAGKSIRLITQAAVHDRWLKKDDQWSHSGHSFKDIGNKLSRISNITDPQELVEHEDMLRELIATGTEVPV